MIKEEITYKNKEFIKFTQEPYISYWCIKGQDLIEEVRMESLIENGPDRIIKFYQAELPNGNLSFAFTYNFIFGNNPQPYPYSGMLEQFYSGKENYDNFKLFVFKKILNELDKTSCYEHKYFKNVKDFLLKETQIQKTLF